MDIEQALKLALRQHEQVTLYTDSHLFFGIVVDLTALNVTLRLVDEMGASETILKRQALIGVKRGLVEGKA